MGWENVDSLESNNAIVLDMSIFTSKTIPSISGSTNNKIDYSNALNLGTLSSGQTLSYNGGKFIIETYTDTSSGRQDIFANFYANDILFYKARIYCPGYATTYYMMACIDSDNEVGAVGVYEYNSRFNTWSVGAEPVGYTFANEKNFTHNVYNAIKTLLGGGGAGSGYIGNSLLSNKKMVGYNVPTSSAEGTKTESVNDVSASAVSGKPKSGNGFVRIKFLHDYTPTFPITSYDKAILFPSDDMPVKLYHREDATVADVYSTFDQRSDTCFLIWDTNTSTYLIYRFKAAEQGGTPFRVVSYQYMEQSGTANEIWGMNAETHELYPTDGYGRSLGRIWLPSIIKDGARYDGAGAYGGVSSEHPTIYCSKLSADVYIDGVLVGHYNHD